MNRFLLALVSAALLIPAYAEGQLEWRVSIKVFTDANGDLPRLPYWQLGGTTLFDELSNGVHHANNVLTNMARGYRFRLTEIVTLPGTTAPLPAATNSWFNLAVTVDSQGELDTKARANSSAFRYRSDAINIYYFNATNGTAGGVCAFPTENQNVITIAPNSFRDVLIHEVGHFFDLIHTHEGERYRNADGSTCTNQCDCAQLLAGDDNTLDTAPDHSCWESRNAVALGAFGLLYADLNSDQRWRVDNTWFNVMSYHDLRVRFTEEQMDMMTEISNTTRYNVATGRTRFVDGTNNLAQDGSRFRPFRTVSQAGNNSAPGDILLIRPGHYNEPGTYSRPVTMRAPRGGVTIGIP